MALGGGGHRLDALVDAAHGAAEVPGGDRQHRLQRNVELAAEAAAAGGGHDADILARQAQDARGLVAVHGRGLGAGVDLDAVADPLRPSGLRLDVGVLDEGGGEGALRPMRRRRQRARSVALLEGAARQHVVGLVGVDGRGAGGQRRLDAGERRQRLPGDRQIGSVDRLHRLARAGERQHRLAAIAHVGLREHRLILEVGIDAEGILARHVGGREHARNAGMAGQERRQIADGEAGAGVGRADGLQPQGVRRRSVVAVDRGAGELGAGVEAPHASADAGGGRLFLADLGSCAGSRKRGRRIEHGIDDLEIAGAAAEHAAEAIHHRLAAGRRVADEQIGGRHQHARGADAALGRVVGVECRLQRAPERKPGEPLHRHDRFAVRLRGGDHARAHLRAVDQHRAGAAVAGVAADLGAREPQPAPHDVAEAFARGHGDALRAAVEREGQQRLGDLGALVHAAASTLGARHRSSARRTRTTATSRRYRAEPRTSSMGVSGAHTSAAVTRCAPPLAERSDEPTFQRRQPHRHGRARADGDGRIGNAPLCIEIDQRRHGDDGDHQVGAGAELEERRPCPWLGLRHADADHQLVRRQGGSAIARDELGERQPTPSAQAGDLDGSIQRQQWRHAVGRRRGIADVAGDGAAVLHLQAADLARGLLEPLECRRQRRVSNLRPGGERSERHAALVPADAPELV